jgi:EAL domain-containing protein (putative c-di-GMP-specific phosphodiesterase class I)/CHASE2 domain-containing sensor protein
VLKLTLFTKILARRRGIMVMMAAAFGLLLLATGAGEAFDHLLRQLRDAVRTHSASGTVEIVEIDARSLAAIDKWPWPRGVHAAAIDRLRKAQVRSIAFDVDFSALSTPDQDAQLADALARAGGSVILPTFRQQASAGSSEFIDSIPAKPFADKAFLAAVTIFPDNDGLVRHIPLGAETGGVPRPSLASMVAESEAQIGRLFEVDYAINPASIPRHSFIDLISVRIPDSALAGKRIIVGATAIEMGDRYLVPHYGVIPGVVIQALAAETLIGGAIPHHYGPALPFALAMLLILLCARPGSRVRRSAVFAAGSLSLFLLPLATEHFAALSFDIAAATAALAAAASVAGAALIAERYRVRVMTDAATGLPNLAALAESAEPSDFSTIVVARIDRFAAIASGLGPETTAKLVSRVADRLHMINREAPIYRTDEASLAWLEQDGDRTTFEDRLQAIIAVMRSPVDCGRLIDVALTLGMADASDEAGDGASDAKQLVANASLAALHASRKGLRWERFTGRDGDETNWHLSLLGELDAAMASGQVWNAYQPKLDIVSGEIIGAEALVRWLHPERGPIPPDNFIPLVEEHGRARDLTFHVLVRALEDAVRWDVAERPIGVAVNVSATLLGDKDFIEQVRETLENSALPNHRVTIEVTESAAMKNPEAAVAALASWRALGVNISIDDYGTGQSSLGYLQKLPATELKIDKSFIQAINSDPRNAIMVRSTIGLAHELGIKVVAEGIEDAACLATLAEMGCDTAQGYHIGRPMSAANLAIFLKGNLRAAA